MIVLIARRVRRDVSSARVIYCWLGANPTDRRWWQQSVTVGKRAVQPTAASSSVPFSFYSDLFEASSEQMAIDHGLGGRDNKKSRERRERKAKRLKTLTKSLSTEGFQNRNEIKFDEAARTAFLTGFHKRKQERRKFGIAMQVLCFPLWRTSSDRLDR